MTARDDAIAAAARWVDLRDAVVSATEEAAKKEREWLRARDERDDAIRAWYDEGASLREIGQLVGLSWSAVRYILNKPESVQSP